MSLTHSSASEIAKSANAASLRLASLSTDARNYALTALHAALAKEKEKILRANARDVAEATRAAAHGELSQSVLKRLDLARPGKYEDMLQGILSVRDLEDPSEFCRIVEGSFSESDILIALIVGKVTLRTLLDDDLILERVTCPLGVLLIIFEARPEVIANIAALAIKSGNAAILKGVYWEESTPII